MTKNYIITKDKVVSSFQTTPDDNHVPSEKLVKDSLDGLETQLNDKQDKHLVTSWGTTLSDGRYPSEKLVKDSLDGKEPTIATKNTAFNKNFGTTAGTVCEGNDSRLSDSRTPTAHHASHENSGTDRIVIDATQITTGVIDAARLPSGAFQKLITVANEAERKALTPTDVNKGDTVKQNDTGVMYFCIDTTQLSTDAGWSVYTAITNWDSVASKPSTFPPSTHASSHVGGTDAIQIATNTQNGLLKKEDWITFNGKQKQHTTTTATVHAVEWEPDNTNTVYIPGLPDNCDIIVSPNDDSYELYGDCLIRAISHASGEIVLKCKTAPTFDLVINVLILESI